MFDPRGTGGVMIKVSCPSCKAAYDVDEHRLPDDGLRMRCPKCSESFQVHRDGSTAKSGGGAAPGAMKRARRKPTQVGMGPNLPPPTPAAAIKSPPLVEKTDITQMSLDDLDRRCEDARDKKIAPLREGEIASCKQEKRTDPNWCESFYADYGDGGRTKNGSIRPRMFDDLPECVDAQQERNRRKL